MTWSQEYNPLRHAAASTVVAALPVAALLGGIALGRMRIHQAALLGLTVALAVAVGVYGMPPRLAAAATAYGAAYGLFPIGWIILNLMFLYQLTVEKGHFAILRGSLATLAPDPRVQVILIAFSLGAFFEGAAGFGTPVAVTAAILIQLGFRPLLASGLSLIANTAPVAFGGLGSPIIALSKVTGISELTLSAMIGRQLPFFSLIIPFWVVGALAGFRGMWEVWPAALGFEPHPDFRTAARVLGGLRAADCAENFTFGKDGKPLYFQGPHETGAQAERILQHLKRRCGEGNFHYVLAMKAGPGGDGESEGDLDAEV